MKHRAARPAPTAAEAASVLGNLNFDRLWGAQILSQIAQNLLNFALIIRVFELAQGTRLANLSVAVLVLSFGLPSIFFAAAAGVYVDHWNKKLVMIAANALRAVLVLGYLVFEHNLVLVLLTSFLISSITQFFTPAEAAAIPAVVRPSQLLRANSLFVFTMYTSFVVGYSASAPVIAHLGPSGPYIVTSIMFAIATVLVVFLPSIHTKQSVGMPFRRILSYTAQEITRNWQVIRSNHNLYFPITQLTITQAILGVLLALSPALSVAVLHRPLQHAFFYLIIPAGLGLVAGVVSVNHLVKYVSKTRLIALGLMVGAAALILISLAGLLHYVTGLVQIGLTTATLVFLLGAINSLVSAAAQTTLQENTTDTNRAKVFGALGMMVNIAATLPIFFAGILADLFGVTQVIGAIGIGLGVFALLQYLWLRRHAKLA